MVSAESTIIEDKEEESCTNFIGKEEEDGK